MSDGWKEAVAVLTVEPDGTEKLAVLDGMHLVGPADRVADVAPRTARRMADTGRHVRVVRFTAREVLAELKPTPEKAAEVQKLADEERAKLKGLGELLGKLAEELKGETKVPREELQ